MVAVSASSSFVASATQAVEVSLWFLRPRTIGAYLQGYVGAGPTGGFNAELGSGYSLPSVTKALPNPSLERTSTGMALGPRGYAGHHPPRGPSATPVVSAQLKR